MNHYNETISKFLDAMRLDSINDVYFLGKCTKYQYCVCGQKIKKGYVLKNKQNNKLCVVGKKCLYYIAYYLGWK